MRVKALAAKLETMNAAPGTADPDNGLLPFGRIPTIHFARFVILDDPSLSDRRQIAPQLPVDEPLSCLSNRYYEPWETIIKQMPQLIVKGTLYDEFARMPTLTTGNLQTTPEWRRAYVILAFFAHAHIWSANQPCEVRYERKDKY